MPGVVISDESLERFQGDKAALRLSHPYSPQIQLYSDEYVQDFLNELKPRGVPNSKFTTPGAFICPALIRLNPLARPVLFSLTWARRSGTKSRERDAQDLDIRWTCGLDLLLQIYCIKWVAARRVSRGLLSSPIIARCGAPRNKPMGYCATHQYPRTYAISGNNQQHIAKSSQPYLNPSKNFQQGKKPSSLIVGVAKSRYTAYNPRV